MENDEANNAIDQSTGAQCSESDDGDHCSCWYEGYACCECGERGEGDDE